MGTAADNPFARRAMTRPLPESLNSDPEHRYFRDPPELVQRALGGREWFFDNNFRSVHRIGCFLGLGWEIDPIAHPDRGYTGVRVVMTANHTLTVSLVVRSTLTNPDLDASTPVLTDKMVSISEVSVTNLKTIVEGLLSLRLEQDAMKIGIAVDDWKLPTFREALAEAGFKYEEGVLTAGTTLLSVETDDIKALAMVVGMCSAQCKLQRRHDELET